MNFHINYSRITTTILQILSINTCYNIISLIIQLVRILAHMDKLDHCFFCHWIDRNMVVMHKMFKAMTILAIIMHIEPDKQAEVVFRCLCQKKCVYSEIIDLCMVNDYIESRFIKINNDVMSLVIGLMYRPPNFNVVQFTENLNDILGQVPRMPYVMGDYTIDLMKHGLYPPT